MVRLSDKGGLSDGNLDEMVCLVQNEILNDFLFLHTKSKTTTIQQIGGSRWKPRECPDVAGKREKVTPDNKVSRRGRDTPLTARGLKKVPNGTPQRQGRSFGR
jgi:hypothetical protein